MKRIDIIPIHNRETECLAAAFVPCGLNADWATTAYHLSAERFTGHAPNKVSGDYYLVENEEVPGAWFVCIRTYAADRPGLDSLDDLVETVAKFDTIADACKWLADAVSQAHYLLSPPEDLNDAMGVPFSADRLASPDLAGPMGPHIYLHDRIHCSGELPESQQVAIGFGDLIVGSVTGYGYGPERFAPGYPMPTIPEARALAAEIVRRWNSVPDLVAALQMLVSDCNDSRLSGPDWAELRGTVVHARRALAQLEGRTEPTAPRIETAAR